jgi:SAM-dependent methyltransferase
MSVSRYPFNNDSRHSPDHHRALSVLLDPGSSARTRALLNLTSKNCWEVGAGGGAFARWLATQVGDGGLVVATDVKPEHIQPHPRLQILAHDITTDPVPGGRKKDFVHARLLLNHLSSRREVLGTLVSALAPDGVLLTEDFYSHPPNEWVAYCPDPDDAALLRDFHAAYLAVLDAHGNSRAWSTQAHAAMLDEGLIDVETIVSSRSWRGGQPGGCELLTAGLAQLRDELVAQGVKPAELDRVQALFADPRVEFHGHHLYSTSGRRSIDQVA